MIGLNIYPLTPARWRDFEILFGKNGACAGCWCRWWRLPRAQWAKQKGAGNKLATRKIVNGGGAPGLLAFADGRPVGWRAVAPREVYPRLASARTLKPIDDQPVWSITCFFVARPFRRRGVTVELLEAAVDFARRNGANIVEGYPVEPKKDQPDVFVYTGLASAFQKAGFEEAVRRSETRPMMRCVLKPAEARVTR